MKRASRAFLIFATLLSATMLVAQSSAVYFEQQSRVFRLDGGNVTYAFGVNPRGELEQLYWGGRLSAEDSFAQAAPMPEWASFDDSYTNTPQEYARWGAGLYVELALKITFADGNRDLVLHYANYTTTEHGFDVELKDIERPIFVTLHYSMDPETGILARTATIENRGAESVTIEQAAAAKWAIPAGQYTLNYLTGRWAGEWTLNQALVEHGETTIESRRGSTGHQANPWFAIQAGASDEEHGEVWFGALGWSGSWRITVERDQLDAIRVTGGFNPFDFGYLLHPGQSLETPIFLWRLLGAWAGRGIERAAPLRAQAHFAAHGGNEGRRVAAREAGYLQLVGGDGVQCKRCRTDGAGRESRSSGPRPICDGRWMVRRTEERPRRIGRLECESGKVSARIEATDRQGSLAGDGFRFVG